MKVNSILRFLKKWFTLNITIYSSDKMKPVVCKIHIHYSSLTGKSYITEYAPISIDFVMSNLTDVHAGRGTMNLNIFPFISRLIQLKVIF